MSLVPMVIVVLAEEWLDHLYCRCGLWAVDEGDEGLAQMRRGMLQIGFATVAERAMPSRSRRVPPLVY
jgi:hypothetical protein